ncbi:MAG: ATP-binding cassette domain-containing protein [Candidatus Syntrophoarchaeum sp.]|nr:ATP-binding cassette domain-containing protein [Candidatus Syntrophoarchaeum sp.]
MHAIEVYNLSYSYPDGTHALTDVNLTVEEGKKTAILGPNGSGKSTLFYHLNGIFLPQKGEVIIKGESITKKNLDWIRSKVGLVFQDPDDQLFAPTVWDDIIFGPGNLGLNYDEIRMRGEQALMMLGISELKDKNPDNLSGGEKKKAAIAGILAMEPDILVFDEPTAGLDPKSTSEIVEIMDELASDGRTIIISTHDVDLASTWADEIFLLNRGRVYASGNPAEIFTDEERIKTAKLKSPIIVRTHREFEAHGIYRKVNRIPLRVLDLVENLNGSKKRESGEIWVVRIPGMKEGGVDAVDPDRLKEVFELNPDKTGAMGTSAKECAKMLGIECDFESDVIDSAISEAIRGGNVLVFASGGMSDLVSRRVEEYNRKSGKTIRWERLI